MGKWMKTFRKNRHLALILGLIAIGIGIWVLSIAWASSIISPDAYVAMAPTITLFLMLFILGILAGISLTTYVILKLTED